MKDIWKQAVRAVADTVLYDGRNLEDLLESDPGLLRASPHRGRGQKGRTLLHHAVAERNLKAIETLVAFGADPNASLGPPQDYPDEPGDRPLHCLASSLFGSSAEDCIKALQAGKNKADINARNANGDSPLHRAAKHNKGLVPAFLACGANPNARNACGSTPLHVAARFNLSSAAAQDLLEAGADVNARNTDGSTPLHLAAERGASPDVVEALLEAGANVNVRDEKNRTPLHGAARAIQSVRPKEDGWKITSALLRAGADANASDANGITALHLAVIVGHEYAVHLLLDHGANPLAKDNKGRLPADFLPTSKIPGMLQSASEKWRASPEEETPEGESADPGL